MAETNDFSEEGQSVRKVYFFAGCLVFAALFAMAWIFYLERVCLADTAFRTMLMINTKKPAVFILRFGSFIPQLLPLAAIWLHLGLKTVMISHSLSFVLLFFLIYILAFRASGQSLLFFLIPLYLIMLTNEEFYWPQSEYQQGMIWLCLYAVFLIEGKSEKYAPWLFFPVHFLFLFWVESFHLLIFIPLSFLLIYYYYSYSSLFARRFYVHGAISVFLLSVGAIAGIFDPYERGKLNIVKSVRNNLPHLFSLGSVSEFWHKLPLEYAGYAFIFLLSLGWFISRRKYLLATALVILSVFYWLIVILSSPDAGRFYTEYLMLPLGFMAALPVVAEILPGIKLKYALPLILIFCTVRIAIIYHSHADYTNRLEIYKPYLSYIQKKNLNGVIVDRNLIDTKKAIMTWASGYESILLSSVNSPDSCSVVQIDTAVSRYGYSLDMDTVFVTKFSSWGKSELPDRYFRLRGGKYEILTRQP